MPEGGCGSYGVWWLCGLPHGLSLALALKLRGRHVWGEARKAGKDRAGVDRDG